jgi:hypothetical protein
LATDELEYRKPTKIMGSPKGLKLALFGIMICAVRTPLLMEIVHPSFDEDRNA